MYTPSRQSTRPGSPARRFPPIYPAGSMSPSIGFGTRGPASPIERTLRRPMSMMTLPSAGSSSSSSYSALGSASRGSSRASTRTPLGTAVFRGTIHVGVRAKPEADSSPQWSVDERNNKVGHATAGDFAFDEVYDGRASNKQVFDRSVQNLIEQVLEGFNGTVFAYGMTGSGKTFSMQGTPQDPGIIPRSVDLIFDLIEKRGGVTTAKVSYLEIYNEKICDLLQPQSDQSAELLLRDDPVIGVRAVGLKEVAVASADELLEQIARGDAQRKTSSTQYNLHSSRSHAVVQISLMGDGKQSMLYLCDLAGSERAVSQVERRKEGSYINKSLLTLGTVISRLSTGSQGHVPFRDSKLTRLLQPSLTGRALVTVLSTIQTSIHSATATETLNTLRFSARAKNIVVIAKRNSLVEDNAANAANERLMQVIEQQRLEIAQLKAEANEYLATREDLQGQLDFYMRLADQGADESLESILMDQPESVAQYEVQAKADKAEIRRLNEQIDSLITQMAEINNELASMGYMGPSGSKKHSKAVVVSSGEQDLLEEIAELKETIEDKNRIIEFLRGSSERRANLDKLAPRVQASELPVSPPQVDFD